MPSNCSPTPHNRRVRDLRATARSRREGQLRNHLYNAVVPAPSALPDPPDYRQVHAPADEGPAFLQTLDRIADFYTREMGGRIREDGPGVRLKWSRDWEYPWVFTRAGPSAGVAVLDCGAGNSPMPYLMAQQGAAVIALDRDAIVASRFRYGLGVAAGWLRELAALPAEARRAAAPRSVTAGPDAGGETGAAPARGELPAPPAHRSLPTRAWRFARHHLVARHKTAWARIVKPDFWGPVSPALLARYRVTYLFGDLTALPFRPSAFDVVTCVSVLEHMPPGTRAAGVRDMARVLKPGGRLILTYDRHERDLTRELVGACGLNPVELVCFSAGVKEQAQQRRPDVIGLHLVKPV
jgi:2-polyprenyl-3-methyl-5-hydroxy-6-metoxy-1,4-benzoquinol methylase